MDIARTVLVVDDESYLRQLVDVVLTTQGYRVIQAKDGFEALELAERNSFDLILTDVVMPGMSGLELVRRLKRRNHGARYLLMSGYDSSGEASAAREEQIRFLEKPFTPARLVAAVHEILEDPTA